MFFRGRLAAVLLTALALVVWFAPACRAVDRGATAPDDGQVSPRADDLIESISVLKKDDGGRLDWSADGTHIVFDRLGSDGYFDIWIIEPDGDDERCLTCDLEGLPGRHAGNPAWHPGGTYIVFQAAKAVKRRLGKLTDYASNPGAGVNNDVWLMDAAGRRAWQLTDTEPRHGGVLHPHFSHDGKRLVWAERVSSDGGRWGTWVIRVATVRLGDEPGLVDVRTFRPGPNKVFYETHGFTKDDAKILFTSNIEKGQEEFDADVCELDLATGEYRKLTDTLDRWDEHAHMSPSGRHIVWMSSMDLPRPRNPFKTMTDYWIMNADGSDKRRLTFFNMEGHPHHIEGGAVAADHAWSPDGRRLAGYLILDPLPPKPRGRIVVIEFEAPQ